MNPLDQLRDEIHNLALLADRLASAKRSNEKPTTNACVEKFLDVRGGDYIATKEIEALAAVRDLCLASRSPSHDLVVAADAMRALFPKAAHDCLLRECSIVDAYDAARAKIGERDAT